MKLAALVGALLIASAAGAQTNSRSDRIAHLLAQLRWQDRAGRERYLASRDDLTHALLGEVDEFISQSFSSSSTPSEIKAGLDRLLGYRQGMTIQNVAWSAEIPIGRFLMVGVEIWRGGGAIAENAMSFRAYRPEGDHFAFVTATEDLSSSVAANDALNSLHVILLNGTPVRSECWFLGWAIVPPRSPYTVAMRLYAFDGQTFRTVWKPMDVVIPSINKVVDVERSSFTVHSLFSPDGNPLPAEEIKHEQFLLTSDGPVPVAEWRTPIQ